MFLKWIRIPWCFCQEPTGVFTTLISMYTLLLFKNKRLYFSDDFISMFHNSFRQLRLTVWAGSYLMSDFWVIADHNLLSKVCYFGRKGRTSLYSSYMRVCALGESMSILISRASRQTKNFQVAHTQNFHERKKSTAKFPPRNLVQQRILQARGHSAGAITSQALPALRAVPGKLLVLSRAQHPLQLQDKQDHRHSALMRWKPRKKENNP